MKSDAKLFAIVTALAVFIGLPLLFYTLGDAPRRSYLKEAISVATLVAFSLMLGQLFLARSNEVLLRLFKPRDIQTVHKAIAYSAIGLLTVHPFLVVLPRYFEAGIKPWDAFVTMLTTFNSLGVVLGLIAWVLMIVLGVTAFLRMRLIKRWRFPYRTWRYAHGVLSVAFLGTAIWHSIELGRHTNAPMAALYITLAVVGGGLLVRLYWAARPARTPIPQGAE
ncbi:ferric reductase-like transmembrane domain-containing protein [Phaeovulum sp.]|uniref:ferric reductase-like transmembrane domain-containing protein n=1 Tax=Phaeovulum sp. TaxID=2934796 RepID=UPI003567F898